MKGTTNRNKGHFFERQWSRTMRDIGYVHCKTSRQASRLLDSCKVDLAFLPFNIQCKNVKANINYINLIKSIKASLAENYPEDDPIINNPIIIAHKRGRTPEEHLVIMEASSFIDIIRKNKEYETIENEKIKKRKNGENQGL